MLIFSDVRDLDLEQTLDCGQSFRWTQREDGSFAGVAFGRAVTVSLDGGELRIEGAEEATGRCGRTTLTSHSTTAASAAS